MSQFSKHLARQAVLIRVNAKKKISAPTKRAPITLVAAKTIARSIIDNKIVPKMPKSNTESVLHILLQAMECWARETATRITAR